ncbi:flagellar hook capping protein [Verrucomicrobiota bacterium]|nr:flagellar hook capping protein [Verrucomicrobiota bacterium]
MPAITTATPTPGPGDPGYQPADNRVTTKTLGQDDFLKLLIAQFTHQDPLNPKSDTDYIGQMANFSNLEMTKGMSNEFAMLRAGSMIGRQVQVQTNPDSATGELPQTLSGVVSEVRSIEGKPVLLINGGRYTLQQVLSISQPPAPAADTQERVAQYAVSQ